MRKAVVDLSSVPLRKLRAEVRRREDVLLERRLASRVLQAKAAGYFCGLCGECAHCRQDDLL